MGRRLGGLRVAARVAGRDALRSRGRALLVALLVGLPLLVGSTGGVLLASLSPTDETWVGWTLGDVAQARIASPAGQNLTQDRLGQSFSTSEFFAEPGPLEEYEAALQQLLGANQLHRGLRHEALIGAAGISTTSEVTELPDGVTPGTVRVADGVLPPAGGIALVADLVTALEVGLGDTVTLDLGDREMTARLSGILEPSPLGMDAVVGPGTFTPPVVLSPEDPFGLADGDAVRTEWYVTGPEPVTVAQVLAINDLGSVVTSRAVALDPASLQAFPRATMPMDPGTLALVAAVVAVVVAEAALLIGPAFAVGALRQQRQFAILTATGADRRTLRQVVLLTGVATGALAAVVGVLAGVMLAAVIRVAARGWASPLMFPDLRIPWLALSGLFLSGVIAVTLAAWWPARTAGAVDVVTVLSGRRPQVRHGKRAAAVGIVIAVVGGTAAAGGAVLGEFVAVAAGTIAVLLGVVLTSGTLVAASARLAPHLGVAGRLAVRDTARNRARSAPAVAALIAAVAGITAGAVYTQSSEDHDARQYVASAAPGTVVTQLTATTEVDELMAQGAEALRATLPVTEVLPVWLAAPADLPERPGAPGTSFSLTAEPHEVEECALFTPEAQDLTTRERRAAGGTPACLAAQGYTVGMTWLSPRTFTSVLVDDGTVVRATGLDGAGTAAAALAAGTVVVGSQNQVWPDGTAHLTYGDPSDPTTAQLPAVAVPLSAGHYDLVLPPAVAEELGLDTEFAGFIAPTSRMPSEAEVRAAQNTLGRGFVSVEGIGGDRSQSVLLLILVGAALVAGVGATGISVALAAAESRGDLATLAAVGADTRMRSRVSAAQSALLALLGTILGIGGGLALGWVLVTVQRYRWEIPDLAWVLAIPWPAVAAIAIGIPVLATAVGWLASPRRLPLTRRTAT